MPLSILAFFGIAKPFDNGSAKYSLPLENYGSADRVIVIDSQFDGGNISVEAIDRDRISLRINADKNADFLQWFYFSAEGVRGQKYTFCIDNAGQATYPKGWVDYDVAMSSDRKTWLRTPTEFDGKTLKWVVTLDNDRVWFAYFAPYSLEQHANLVAATRKAPGVGYESLGTTHLGRSIDYLKLSDSNFLTGSISQQATAKHQIWTIARQHPGEPMSEWWMQGWIARLLDVDDATSVALRNLADIHIVPNMNPDGTCLGHLRTNSVGANLNREWRQPSVERSPEVYCVKNKMQQTGVDIALDVHGDEALPYNFIAGTEGIDSWNDRRDRQLRAVKHTWTCLNPDFQSRHGYSKTPRGQANLAICSNQLASSFGCLAMTLEMPFKDTADSPRKLTGWSPQRCLRLGASFVDIVFLTLTDNLLLPDD